MKFTKKMNRYERREYQAEKLKNSFSGTGLFVYENNTDGSLTLPKPTASGLRVVEPRKQFQGDSYYMSLVGAPMNLLKFIHEIQPQKKEIFMENTTQEKQLLLDQPDTITNQGKVERVVIEPKQTPINDSKIVDLPKETLLVEEPNDAVSLIFG